jgi:uncharacterized protein (TIGR04255 family)
MKENSMSNTNLHGMSFIPANDGVHAIVSTVFSFYFSKKLDVNEIQKLKENLSPDKLENAGLPLPDIKEIKEFVLSATHGKAEEPQISDAGVELHWYSSNGGLDWIMTANNSFIQIQCFNYTRWADIFKHVRTLVSLITPTSQEMENLHISKALLHYVDQFDYAPESEYKLETLFKEDTDYLAKHCFSRDKLWHCHNGWFEEIEAYKCLNQLNIEGIEMDNTSYSVMVSHSQVFDSDKTFKDFDSLAPYFETMHSQNKNLLQRLLTHKIVRRLSLED